MIQIKIKRPVTDEQGNITGEQEINAPLQTKFNYYAIEQFGKVKGEADSNVVYTVRLLYCGYLGYCFAKQQAPEITYEEILDWLDESIDDEAALNEIALVKKAWTESTAFEKLIKKGLAAQEKKSQPMVASPTTE